MRGIFCSCFLSCDRSDRNECQSRNRHVNFWQVIQLIHVRTVASYHMLLSLLTTIANSRVCLQSLLTCPCDESRGFWKTSQSRVSACIESTLHYSLHTPTMAPDSTKDACVQISWRHNRTTRFKQSFWILNYTATGLQFRASSSVHRRHLHSWDSIHTVQSRGYVYNYILHLAWLTQR